MRFLITAGGTREYIDPVRFISNASSGRMGYALARAALKAGHEVTLITAPTALKLPAGAKVVPVQTAAEMFKAVKQQFPKCDCLIMAAAVSDYTPAHRSKTKLKKQPGKLTLELKPTPDILKWAGRRKKRQIVVGFALEDRDLRANAERKLREKHLDLIIANTPGAIGSETSTLHIKKPLNAQWFEVVGKRKARSQGRSSFLLRRESEMDSSQVVRLTYPIRPEDVKTYLKYCSNEDNVIEGVFSKHKIRFTQPAALNDPLEFNPIIRFRHSAGKYVNYVFDDIVFPSEELRVRHRPIERQLNDYGILSLTKTVELI